MRVGTLCPGPTGGRLKQAFAAFCGVKHCISLNSGTSPLHVALRRLDVGPGDEVITVPFTFVATTWAISYVGAKPVFVDVDSARAPWIPAASKPPSPRAPRPSCPYIFMACPPKWMRSWPSLPERGIPVVEDAAQAHGARYAGRSVGQFGCMACFSFYPGKNLGGYGEGGALVTDSDDFAARARRLRPRARVNGTTTRSWATITAWTACRARSWASS